MLELLSTNYTSPTGSRNYGRFSNSEFDALVDKALTQLDAEERKTTLLAAQDILLEEGLAARATHPLRQFGSRFRGRPRPPGGRQRAADA